MAAITGFSSSFAIVLAGLVAVGATQSQAASGLLVICLIQGLLSIVVSIVFRVPVKFAWSTPGAALLVATAGITGQFSEAVAAFVVTALLIVLVGLWPALGRLIAKIPRPIANAMLAGILLPLCLAPVKAAVEIPFLAIPVILVWLLLCASRHGGRCRRRSYWRCFCSPLPWGRTYSPVLAYPRSLNLWHLSSTRS